MIVTIFWVVFILFLWFDTDAFVEYSKFFRLAKSMKVDKYLEHKNLNPKASYHTYLRKNYTNFFTRLITCPSCIAFWIVLFFCIVGDNLFFYPIIYIISFSIYMLLKKKILS